VRLFAVQATRYQEIVASIISELNREKICGTTLGIVVLLVAVVIEKKYSILH